MCREITNSFYPFHTCLDLYLLEAENATITLADETNNRNQYKAWITISSTLVDEKTVYAFKVLMWKRNRAQCFILGTKALKRKVKPLL